ncbi:class II glutamine amidotransferase [Candidatus Woesearchaeota archaeon]|nr:class II glutamine amidotransferase [Candidatus Woesearchaeota archaeon]
MLIALGIFDTKAIITDTIKIAKGENEVHEKNISEVYKHEDGWGIAYLDSKNKWEVFKSIKPIFEDDTINEFRNLKTRALIIHVRRATRGKLSVENNQPFIIKRRDGEYLFVHNGTIYDQLNYSNNYLNTSDTDSAEWFNYIIGYMQQNKGYTKNILMKLNNFDAANFCLVTPMKIVIGEKYTKNPKYYSIKLHRGKSKFIVCSEILPTMRGARWERLANGSIIELPLIKYLF